MCTWLCAGMRSCIVEGGRANTQLELWGLEKQWRLFLSPFLSQFYSAILLARF